MKAHPHRTCLRLAALALLGIMALKVDVIGAAQPPVVPNSGIPNELAGVARASLPRAPGRPSFSGGSGDPSRMETETVIRVDLKTQSQADAMEALRAGIEELVVSRGATFARSGERRANRELSGFSLDYRWKDNEAIIRARARREGDGLEVTIFCYEYRRYGP